MIDRVYSHTPKCESLTHYIDCYYFHESFHQNSTRILFDYPHYKEVLIVSLNSDETLHVDFSRNYFHPKEIVLDKDFQRLGIVFKPLGIYHFLPKTIAAIPHEIKNYFSRFDERFMQIVRDTLNESNIDGKVGLLDGFFLNQKKEIDFSSFEPILKQLFVSPNVSLEEFAISYGVSGKTIYRQFKNNLHCSFESYKKLIRFRYAFNQLIEINRGELGTIAHNNYYYDQSDFIKQFKAFTKKTPSEILAQIKSYGDHDIYWSIVDHN
ncbi:MAG: helix-turn-helix domain-containing protein [Flavobacteriales bacterium]|nr:helix-turn-helix domain-containing protein [Flavobacteriales bacterium]